MDASGSIRFGDINKTATNWQIATCDESDLNVTTNMINNKTSNCDGRKLRGEYRNS